MEVKAERARATRETKEVRERGVAERSKEEERVRAATESARVAARRTEEAAEGGRSWQILLATSSSTLQTLVH